MSAELMPQGYTNTGMKADLFSGWINAPEFLKRDAELQF